MMGPVTRIQLAIAGRLVGSQGWGHLAVEDAVDI
jgi:hypothetical protein